MVNIQNIMKQAQEMQQKMQELQDKMVSSEFDGQAGGGLVKVTVNGKGEMRKLSIDDSIIDPAEKEVMEDLIIAAFNDAKNNAESNFNDEMGNVTGGMQLPGDMKLPF